MKNDKPFKRKKKENYYTEQINKVLKNHNNDYNLTLVVSGTENKSNNIKLPFELALLIKNYYYLNGEKL